MIIDLRLMAFATLGKKLEKTLNNDEAKKGIRSGDVTYKFADYCNVSLGKYTQKHYEKDGKTIELDTTKIIQDYCKANGINIIEETKENYKVTFKPSQKAINEYKTSYANERYNKLKDYTLNSPIPKGGGVYNSPQYK